MRLVGTAAAVAAVGGAGAAVGGGSVLLASRLDLAGHPRLAPLLAALAAVAVTAALGWAAGRRVGRHLRRIVSELAVEADGALDGLPGIDPPDAATGGERADGTTARPQTRPLRPLPVRELQRLGDALVALGARVRLADDLADRHRREADAAARGMVEMLSGLVAAEEGARGQLSAELHDTAAQSLASARRVAAELAEARDAADRLVRREQDPHDPAALLPTQPTGGPAGRGAPRAPSAPPALLTSRHDPVGDLVAEAEDALRATMARARPPALRDGDLAAAVGLLRDDLEVRYGLRVDLGWPDQAFPIPLAVAVTVYRFFQEALLNVVKHADVDEARASLVVDERHVVATVRDAGGGFQVAAQPIAGAGGRHVGLGLLRERARLAGGGVQVTSVPGDGTTLTLRLPRPAMPVD